MLLIFYDTRKHRNMQTVNCSVCCEQVVVVVVVAFFLACEDFLRMFDNSFTAYSFLFF